LQAATARDLDRVLDGLGEIAEQVGHLLRRLEVLLRAVATRSLRVVEQRAVVDADARLVGLEVFRANETNVVRGDDGHAACARKLHGGIEIGLFAGASSALQLEIVAVAEQAEPEIERCRSEERR